MSFIDAIKQVQSQSREVSIIEAEEPNQALIEDEWSDDEPMKFQNLPLSKSDYFRVSNDYYNDPVKPKPEGRARPRPTDKHNIITQLRNVQDFADTPHEKRPQIRFTSGKRAHVDINHANAILKLHDHPNLKTRDKRILRARIARNPEQLAKHGEELHQYFKQNKDLQEDVMDYIAEDMRRNQERKLAKPGSRERNKMVINHDIITQLRNLQDLSDTPHESRPQIRFTSGRKSLVDIKHVNAIMKLYSHPNLKVDDKRKLKARIARTPENFHKHGEEIHQFFKKNPHLNEDTFDHDVDPDDYIGEFIPKNEDHGKEVKKKIRKGSVMINPLVQKESKNYDDYLDNRPVRIKIKRKRPPSADTEISRARKKAEKKRKRDLQGSRTQKQQFAFAEAVYHDDYGVGQTINACLDENDQIIFYDVIFEDGSQIRVPTTDVSVLSEAVGMMDSDFKIVKVRLPSGKVIDRRYKRRTKVASNKQTRNRGGDEGDGDGGDGGGD